MGMCVWAEAGTTEFSVLKCTIWWGTLFWEHILLENILDLCTLFWKHHILVENILDWGTR
jgi:hypothetical protein